MTKNRRWTQKPKNESVDKVEESTTTSPNPKSILQSVSKYAYIVAAAALLSGIFTPLTIGADLSTVVYGVFTILLGLSGGILIFLGIKKEKFRSVMVCIGLGLMLISMIIIYELADRSIFQ